MSRIQLFHKSTQQLKFFCLSSQSLYFGSTHYTVLPLSYVSNCSYKGNSLSLNFLHGMEEFTIKDRGLGTKILNSINSSARASKQTIEQAIKQLCGGIYFVICLSVDTWSTNRSKQSSFSSPLNIKENKIIWTDRCSLFISNSKCNIRKASKLMLNEIQRIIVKECYESYKISIYSKKLKEECISFYSSDFFKIREFVVGLEYLCLSSLHSSYIGKPQSSICLLFKKAIYSLKIAKEEGNYMNYK